MLTKLNNTLPLILAFLITIQSCSGAPNNPSINGGHAPSVAATSVIVTREATELQRYNSTFLYKDPTPDAPSDAPPVDVNEDP
ncbi:hypothetical protein EST38_g5731 [Candolleomyces aberdarensis]|uniref:Uncharacterized protein n=1 Tax=Candolleomyces aberdarensis TaxID=2316362 RepID=A0A4Q2DJM9_9AGAR|nr:hypothetical protein EST38_g5731 [Candolleomyces aberdarensis]